MFFGVEGFSNVPMDCLDGMTLFCFVKKLGFSGFDFESGLRPFVT